MAINTATVINDIKSIINLIPYLCQIQGGFVPKILFLIHEYQVLEENHASLRTDYLALREAYCELCNEVATSTGRKTQDLIITGKTDENS